MFDLTDPKSFETVKEQMKYINERQVMKDKNVVIVGNKLDLCMKNKEARKIHKADAKKFAQEFGAQYLEVSANTGHNIDKIFDLVTAELCM